MKARKGQWLTGVALLAAALTVFAAVPAPASGGRYHGRGYGHHLVYNPWPVRWSHGWSYRYHGHYRPYTHYRYSAGHYRHDGFRGRGYGGRAVVLEPYPYGASGRPFWGTVLGGVAGGVLGSSVGRGAGRAAAIVGGAIVGSVVGGSVGRYMDDVDRLYVARTLETVPSGRVSAWQNPDTRTHYEVEPLRTFQRGDGRYCREYQTRALVGGVQQEVYGTACRQPDGSWELQR